MRDASEGCYDVDAADYSRYHYIVKKSWGLNQKPACHSTREATRKEVSSRAQPNVELSDLRQQLAKLEALEAQRKREVKARRESERLLARIYVESPIAIQVYDSCGRLTSVNKACLDMVGLSDVAGFHYRGLFDNPFVPRETKKVLCKGEVVRYELRFDFDRLKEEGIDRKTKSGIAYFDVVISSLGMRRGHPTGYLQQIQDITHRKHAEIALRELSRRFAEVQESERRHIACELHDEIGQALTGLKLSLELVASGMAQAGVSDLPDLAKAQSLLNEIMGRVGQISLDLRPPMLDDLGLLSALEWHFERYTLVTGVQVRFEAMGLVRRLSPDVETAVYRIVQEALTNIARHSRIREATVRLLADSGKLIVRVEDHGRGFDPEAVLRAGTSSGIVGMRERAISLGGRLAVNSACDHGTSIVAEFPLGNSKRGESEVRWL